MKRKETIRNIMLIALIGLIITGFRVADDALGDNKLKDEKPASGKWVQPAWELPEATVENIGIEWVEETETHPLKLTDEERALVEGIIASEARGESIECMMACAQAIRDRVLESGKSVTSVCTAKNQFAQPFKGKLSKGLKEKISDAVLFTFDMGVDTLEYPTRHFYAYNLIPAPGWTKNLEHRGDIDGVRFYE